MHGLMLKADPEGLSEKSVLLRPVRLHDGLHSASHSLLIVQDLVQRWPLVGYFAVGVAFLGIVDIGIDSTLKDELVAFRLGRFSTRSPGQMDICVVSMDRTRKKIVY